MPLVDLNKLRPIDIKINNYLNKKYGYRLTEVTRPIIKSGNTYYSI